MLPCHAHHWRVSNPSPLSLLLPLWQPLFSNIFLVGRGHTWYIAQVFLLVMHLEITPSSVQWIIGVPGIKVSLAAPKISAFPAVLLCRPHQVLNSVDRILGLFLLGMSGPLMCFIILHIWVGPSGICYFFGLTSFSTVTPSSIQVAANCKTSPFLQAEQCCSIYIGHHFFYPLVCCW